MGLLCRVEGWPLQPPIPENSRESLAALVRQTILSLPWVGDPPSVIVTRGGQTIRIDTSLASGDAQWRELAQLAAVAMVMSMSRPLWLWTIRDAGGLLQRKLRLPDLVAWRGIYGTHPTPTPAWSPAEVRKDRALDAKVRYVLAQVIEPEMRQLGLHIPEPVDGASRRARLLLFDYQPAERWRQDGEDAGALALIGRSMVQADGRRSRDGSWAVSLRAEVLNPSTVPLAGVRVQARFRDPNGAIIGTFEASSGEVPPGSVRLVNASGEVFFGRLSIATVDLGCEAMLSRTVSFPATIREV